MRTQQSTSCGYCGADFTLHEQDLDTVCPGCFARVSDQAKFCHHCGLALLPEPYVDQRTPLLCPACGRSSRLSHRQIGGVPLIECNRCAGFWLDNGVFERLVERASHDALNAEWSLPTRPKRATMPGNSAAQRGPLYRQCPLCGRLMNRRNYGRRSGVIIDACRDHGLWFDGDELSRVLAWVHAGKQAEAQQQEADEAARQQQLDAALRIARLGTPLTQELHGGWSLLAALVQFASWWLA